MDHKSKQGWKVMIPHTAINPDVRKYLEDRGHTIFLYPSRPGVDVSFSEIESPSLLVRRGSLSLLRGRKSNCWSAAGVFLCSAGGKATLSGYSRRATLPAG